MDIIKCNVHGCDHILCNRHSDKYGYICDECFEKLVEYVNKQPVIKYGGIPEYLILVFFNYGYQKPTENSREEMEKEFVLSKG